MLLRTPWYHAAAISRFSLWTVPVPNPVKRATLPIPTPLASSCLARAICVGSAPGRPRRLRTTPDLVWQAGDHPLLLTFLGDAGSCAPALASDRLARRTEIDISGPGICGNAGCRCRRGHGSGCRILYTETRRFA